MRLPPELFNLARDGGGGTVTLRCGKEVAFSRALANHVDFIDLQTRDGLTQVRAEEVASVTVKGGSA
jgi:hypothetical protein